MEAINPFFSVVVPTYNRAQLIIHTLRSLLAQTFTDFEIIIVDDGSSDHTDAVVAGIKDPRLSYYKKENGERGAARNYGIARAKGRYVTFVDSDDQLYPHALQHAFDCLTRLDFPPCFAQAFEIVDAATGRRLQPATVLREPVVNRQILKGNFLGCMGVFVQRELLQAFPFDGERMFAGTEDWLLWLQLAARFPFHYSNTVCACMIEHSTRSVLHFSEEKLIYRATHLIEKLEADPVFLGTYGSAVIKKLYAHMLSYTSLHLAISRQKTKALQYLIKAIQVNYEEFFSRRALGIFKTILLKSNP